MQKNVPGKRTSSRISSRKESVRPISRLSRLLALLLVAASCWCASEAVADPIRPNIVFVLTDDLDKATMDVQPPVMPNVLSLLGKRGALSQRVIQRPLCGPSRATMLTGRYAQNTRSSTMWASTAAFRLSAPMATRVPRLPHGCRAPATGPDYSANTSTSTRRVPPATMFRLAGRPGKHSHTSMASITSLTI